METRTWQEPHACHSNLKYGVISLRDPHTDSSALRYSKNSAVYKAPSLYVKEIHLLNLEQLLGWNWNGWNSLGSEALQSSIFISFLHLESIDRNTVQVFDQPDVLPEDTPGPYPILAITMPPNQPWCGMPWDPLAHTNSSSSWPA